MKTKRDIKIEIKAVKEDIELHPDAYTPENISYVEALEWVLGDETLDKLTKEIHDIATTGVLPDGDRVESVVVMLWFEAWAEKLTNYKM